jgi:hypothetical protein
MSDIPIIQDDGLPIYSGAPSATDEILAFHYGNFDNHYGDGTVGTAAANGRVYADTVPGSLPTKFGTIGTPSTASGQTTYTWTPPPTSLQANVLLVAGGGGGGGVTGNGASGGGGAGGLVFDRDRTITSGSQTIVVGNGGAGGGNARVNGENGKNSTAFGLTANGGGGGGGSSDGTAWNAGSAGGSGGGGGGGDVNPNGAGGASTQPGTNTGVYIDAGFAGGGSLSSLGDCGAGGGGAGEKGGDFLGDVVGNRYYIQGGNGLLLGAFGETYGQSGWFAGGGGAFGRNLNASGAGGLGGGGAGGSSGTNHTGGGGGGRDAGVTAGNGGSGIVAIRYIVDNTIVSAKAGVFNYVSSSEYTSTSPTLYSNDTSGDWVTVYEVSNPTRDGGGNIQYILNNSIDLSGYSYTRVGYLLTHKFPGKSTVDWVLCTFDKWSSTITDLRVPDLVDAFTNQRNVTNLNVYSSNQTAQPNRNNVSGRLEIWPYNYSAAQSGLLPAGSNTLFDYDDTTTGSSGYGSFQCHDITNGVTCLSWSKHAGPIADIGIGNNVATNPFYDSSGHLDWTYAQNYNSDFNLKIMVM